MKNKLKLILWGKNLELPMNYDKLKFDNYELKYNNKYGGYELFIYKNNEIIKEIYYFENRNKGYEWNYKNKEKDGKQYGWFNNGELYCEDNYKNGVEIK